MLRREKYWHSCKTVATCVSHVAPQGQEFGNSFLLFSWRLIAVWIHSRPCRVWSWRGNFWFHWRFNCVMWCFLGIYLIRGCFAEADTWENVLLRTEQIYGVWKLSGKRAWDVLLEWMLERTCDVQKESKYNLTDSGWHCGIGLPCWSLLGFADPGLYRLCIGLPCFLCWFSLVMTL